MKKSAFTMLELVFVIVAIGILSAVFIPKFGQNKLSEAANQVISHIRYTQHLALMDDKFDPTSEFWYRQRWQIFFSGANATQSYMIFSDSPSNVGAYDGNPGADVAYTDVEVARNPLNKSNYLIGTAYSSFANSDTSRLSEDLDLEKKYGIVEIKVTGGTTSTAKRIAFDHLGRPYKGAVNGFTSSADGLATTQIYVKLCREETCKGSDKTANTEKEAVIVIDQETGYVHQL